MKRALFLLLVFAVAFQLGALAALAQGHGQGRPGGGPPSGHGPGAGPRQPAPRTMDRGGRPQSGPGATQPQNKKTVGNLLARNQKLSARLQEKLPEGTDLQEAAGGFKNLGQFVAAVHVSNNLGIPFSDLKGAMTGESPQSLGEAIHTLRPEVNAKAEEKKAKAQAKRDMKESGA